MPGELELVLADRTRVPVVDEMTIGRAPGSTLQLDDPAVSRRQARISVRHGEGQAMLEDAGSSYGTWLDGQRVNGPHAAARRLADPGRQPGAGGRAPARRGRGREDLVVLRASRWWPSGELRHAPEGAIRAMR